MLDYNTIFFVACQDRNGFLFSLCQFYPTLGDFLQQIDKQGYSFFALYVQLHSIEIIAKKAVLHLVTHHLHKKRSRIAALYTKKPPRTPPQWEESSTVFVYRVCVFSVVSFSSAKNRSIFFCARTSSCISFRALR